MPPPQDGYARFTALFNPTGPPRLFVFFQPRDVRGADGEVHPGAGAPVLFATLGNEDRIRRKALYFLRNTAPGKSVDLDVASGADLMLGESRSQRRLTPLAATTPNPHLALARPHPRPGCSVVVMQARSSRICCHRLRRP